MAAWVLLLQKNWGCYYGVAMQSLRYSGWLLGYCYVLPKVFWMVARTLCNFLMCSRWLLWRCYAVAKLF